MGAKTSSYAPCKPLAVAIRLPRRCVMERLTMSVNEFCESVGIGRTKAYEILNSGVLEVVRLGRRTLITKSSVDALLKRLAVTG